MASGDQRLASTLGRRYALGCLIPLIGLPVCFLLFMVVGLVVMALPVSDGVRAFLFVALLFGTLALLGGGVIFFFLRRRKQHVAGLDAAFGSTGERWMVSGRRWTGEYEGRALTATVVKGPRVEIHLAAQTAGQLSVGQRSRVGQALARSLSDLQPLELPDDPAFRTRGVFARDADWARTVLTTPSARELVLALTDVPEGRELRQVHVRPDGVAWTIAWAPTSAITRDLVQTTLRRIDELIEHVAPPPT